MRARLLVALLALLTLPLVVRANEQRFGYCSVQTTGARVTGCLVTVYLTGTTTLAPNIYSDNLNTPLANPFQANLTTGLWSFYAPNGRYDVNFSGGSPSISPPYTLSDYLLDDPNGVGVTQSLAALSSQSANPAQSGFVQMALGDCLSWRNAANTADNCLTENGANQLVFGGSILAYTNVVQTWPATQTFQSVASLTTATSIPATTGVVRLASSDAIAWSNTVGTDNYLLNKLSAADGNVPTNTLIYEDSVAGALQPIWGSPIIASSNPSGAAVSGQVRLGSFDTINWRNPANTADNALGTDTNGNLTWPNSVGVLNGAVTTCTGIPAEYAAVDSALQSGNISSTTLLTVTRTTPSCLPLYRVTAYVVVTTPASVSSTLPSIVISWTDNDSGAVQSFTLTPTASGNAATTFQQATMALNPQVGTVVSYSTTGYASSGATQMKFSAHIRLETF
jgi:hypothetical protein